MNKIKRKGRLARRGVAAGGIARKTAIAPRGMARRTMRTSPVPWCAEPAAGVAKVVVVVVGQVTRGAGGK